MKMGKPLTPAQAVLFGTLTVGTLDILDAFIFFGLLGVAPVRILHSIASGLLGRAAYEGGAATAALGLGLHFFIAFGIVAVYVLASRWLPVLARRPWVYGLLYGLLVYAVMNYVVVPLSAASLRPPSGLSLVNGLLIHALGIGLPSALFARATRS
jgi:hypothetical protein